MEKEIKSDIKKQRKSGNENNYNITSKTKKQEKKSVVSELLDKLDAELLLAEIKANHQEIKYATLPKVRYAIESLKGQTQKEAYIKSRGKELKGKNKTLIQNAWVQEHSVGSQSIKNVIMAKLEEAFPQAWKSAMYCVNQYRNLAVKKQASFEIIDRLMPKEKIIKKENRNISITISGDDAKLLKKVLRGDDGNTTMPVKRIKRVQNKVIDVKIVSTQQDNDNNASKGKIEGMAGETPSSENFLKTKSLPLNPPIKPETSGKVKSSDSKGEMPSDCIYRDKEKEGKDE